MSIHSMNNLESSGASLKNMETLLQRPGIELLAVVIHGVTDHRNRNDGYAFGAAKSE